jgi:hypothetical protein
MKPVETIEKLIKKINVIPSAEMDKRMLKDILEAQGKANKITSADHEPSVWRIIMKSRITKFAIAAVILIAAAVSITFLTESATPAYAIEQTIEAIDGIKYFHLKQFDNSPQKNLCKEAWVEYGPNDVVKNFRVDFYARSEIYQSVAWKEGKTEEWDRSGNLVFFEDADYTARILFFASRFNPKSALEFLDSLEKEGKVKIQIEEPAGQNDILATVVYEPNTYLLQRQMPAMKDVYHIDNVSRLVKAVEIFQLEPNGPKYLGSWEYCDYNQPFAPNLLDLDKEAPADVNRIDMMTMDIGIEQGDLSDDEVVVEVAAQFWDALVDKDYALAGKLVTFEMTEQQARQQFGDFHILKVVSIGVSIKEPGLDQLMHWTVPFKAVIEENGKAVERESDLKVMKVLGHPTRWAVEPRKLK